LIKNAWTMWTPGYSHNFTFGAFFTKSKFEYYMLYKMYKGTQDAYRIAGAANFSRIS
jgi:hypothetical protein